VHTFAGLEAAVAVNSGELMAALRVEFPELVDELDEPSGVGLLHLETACLARATEAAMSRGDRATVRTHFEFVHRAWVAGDDEVQNALAVSYFENLDFRDEQSSRSWAIPEIPEVLVPVATELSIGVAG
jgi:hypothetical protein